MSVSGKLSGKAMLSILNKEVDWNSDSIKVALCTSSYTPDQDAHDYYNDLTNELTTTGGYTAGGAVIGTCTAAYDAGTNIMKLDGADVTWTTATITCRYAVIYDDTPATAATKPLIGYIDFGADVGSIAGDFTIQWHADGIFTFTVA